MKKFLSLFLVLLLVVGCGAPKSNETQVISVTTKGHAEGLQVEVTFWRECNHRS